MENLTKIVDFSVRAALDEFGKFHNKLYSIDEVADRLSVSRQTIYRMIKPNENGVVDLHTERVGRHLKVSGWEIGRFLAYGGSVKRDPN